MGTGALTGFHAARRWNPRASAPGFVLTPFQGSFCATGFGVYQWIQCVLMDSVSVDGLNAKVRLGMNAHRSLPVAALMDHGEPYYYERL